MAIPQPVLDVHAAHPQLLQANTHQTDAHFCYFCCRTLGPDWGLLSKSPGENGYTWPNGVRTSHDAIINRTNQEIRDIIASAGSGQPTSPAWIGPQPRRPDNNWTALSAVPAPGGVNPPPPLPPPPPLKPYPGDLVWDQFGAVIESDYKRAGRLALDAQAFRWAGRTIWDAVAGDASGSVLALDQSIAKHRKEWCDILGIPVQ